MALGGLHLAPVGTPTVIAYAMQEWIDVADVDGFNLSITSNPEDVCGRALGAGTPKTRYDVEGLCCSRWSTGNTLGKVNNILS